jgi:hypothetical protein
MPSHPGAVLFSSPKGSTMDTPIPLTAEDWSEIYYALEVKAQRIEEGKYPLENKAGDNQRWAEHLRKIMQKIGPDGTTAIQAGVAGMAGPTAAVPASTEDALIQTVAAYADQAGWDADSQITLVLRYLASTSAAAGLNDFLAEVVEGEQEAGTN